MVIKSRFLSLYLFSLYITHIIFLKWQKSWFSTHILFLFSVFVSFERFWDGPQRVCPHRRQCWVDSMLSSRCVPFLVLNIFTYHWIYLYIYTSVCIHMYLWHETSLVASWILFFLYKVVLCAVCFSPDAISWCCFPSPCLFGISNVGTFAVDFRACPHGPVTHLGTWLQLTI